MPSANSKMSVSASDTSPALSKSSSYKATVSELLASDASTSSVSSNSETTLLMICGSASSLPSSTDSSTGSSMLSTMQSFDLALTAFLLLKRIGCLRPSSFTAVFPSSAVMRYAGRGQFSSLSSFSMLTSIEQSYQPSSEASAINGSSSSIV